eukprot:TRINITY_DN14619_c0_g1_i14.p1 TRINITY_DN14619_c0_g1~~TRINITY_DN14619_c0_g1_i14.p1  ORF type:complete len:201 (-),score=29.54 TRINITY_DN14619_c0_g1_i14:105-707(-)
MGRMFPGKWPDFIETCIQWTVWNGMQGGLYERFVSSPISPCPFHFPSLFLTIYNTPPPLSLKTKHKSSMDYFRNGIMMIADLENMGWENIDLTLQSRMSSALLDNFPMRTCKILILNPPWILNAFLDALRLVIKKKVMDRVYVLQDKSELLVHVSKENLHSRWGGDLHYEMPDWFSFCVEQDQISSLNRSKGKTYFGAFP